MHGKESKNFKGLFLYANEDKNKTKLNKNDITCTWPLLLLSFHIVGINSAESYSIHGCVRKTPLRGLFAWKSNTSKNIGQDWRNKFTH